jgi:tetratricopeptide (TPR) repeat protein
MAEAGAGVELPPAAQRLLRQAEQAAAGGATAAAIAHYRQLVAQCPGYADGWYNLARQQRLAGDYRAALDSYATALGRQVRDPEEVHLNRAVIFSDALRDPSAALRELRTALALNPRYAPALANLATLQEDLGERAAARTTYEELLGLRPQDAQALARYAQLFGPGPEADRLGLRLQGALAAPDLPPADRASLGFALARLLDAAGNYREAFRAATAANQASRTSLSPPARYDRSAQEAFTDSLVQMFPKAHARRAQAPAGDPRPIFICGMFRSGSTLAEQILAGHREVTAGGELELLPRLVGTQLAPFPAAAAGVSEARLAQLAEAYGEGLRQLAPLRPYVTDKRPDNFLLIGLIKALFPQARIVHTTRAPLDNCLSIHFLHLDPRLSYALDLADTGHFYRQYRRLMAHWRALHGADILDFNYDALVAEPRKETARLLEFLGLPWQEDCLDFSGRAGSVRTASVWQVREGLYRSASGRAQHYAAELAALAADLAKPP